MIILLTLMLTLPKQITLEVEVPAATAYFEDLNGDGIGDFWLRSDDDRLWVLDGSQPESPLLEITFEAIAGINPRPIQIEGQWLASFMDDDHRVLFLDGQWQAQKVWHTRNTMRDPRFIRELGQQTLVPTAAGFELYQAGCYQRTFHIQPSVTLKRTKLNVVYPVIQPVNLDNDGQQDWIGTPVAMSNQGRLGIWRALGAGEGAWVMLDFPPDRAMSLYAFGDVDGDGYPELAVMTRPARGFSLFEEMGILFYRGTGPGEWSQRPSQEMESGQNLWQTGPVTLNRGGLYCYYYKGFLSSRFRLDRYSWNPDGYLEPRAKSEDWKMDEAERLTLIHDYDFTNDGQPDLVLADNTGMYMYEANPNDAVPFQEKRREKLLDWPFEVDFDMETSAGEDLVWFPESDVLTDGWLRYSRSMAMVREAQDQLSFWYVERQPETGFLEFTRHAQHKVKP